MIPQIIFSNRTIGPDFLPLVIAEIGINHEGSINKAYRMIDDAKKAGCECIKIQSHIPQFEMIPNDVIPGNANESIWDIISRCTLSEDDEFRLKEYTEKNGLIFLSTPFSKEAALRLHEMGVPAFKIGSGECNNYPLIEYISQFGKPIILSTGMNNLDSIGKAVQIFRKNKIPYALMHCTSLYPTPYNKVRLGAISQLHTSFPEAVIGLSDHSIGSYTCFAAIPLGASILEKHFTSDKSWPGPDISISLDPQELNDLIVGSKAIHLALGGSKEILPEEQPTIDFAYSSVVAIRDIEEGEIFTKENIWVKRPGRGGIRAEEYWNIIGKMVIRSIKKDSMISRQDYRSVFT